MTRSRCLQTLLLAGLGILALRSIDFRSLLAEDRPPRVTPANQKKAASTQNQSKRTRSRSEAQKDLPGVSPSRDSSRDKRKAAARTSPAQSEDAQKVAARVDELIGAELARSHTDVAPRTSDADFLRRASLDITGTIPTPEEVTLFALDPDANKRSALIDRLLTSSAYATNWARYWRDVIFMRATETRPFIVQPSQRAFEAWMAGKLRDNTHWDKITTELLTATGGAGEDGQTALIFAQRAEPEEVAAETSRIFLGIQLQCANCHDHPSDGWKREQFHGLAAFFPRVQMRRKPESNMPQAFEIVSFSEDGGRGRFDFQRLQENPGQFIRRFDRDGDNKVSREELRGGPGQRLLEVGDVDKDGMLSADEIRKIPPPPMMDGRGALEYYMPDLSNPQSQGTKFEPTFFLGNQKPGTGLSDLERRQHLAELITSPDNQWFAKALVNRMWAQLVGEGFYMPVDDIGPERTANHPEALEVLSKGFVASGYDLRWLLRAIASTETYQRQIRHLPPSDSPPHFASSAPVRLRADELFTSLVRVLGINEDAAGRRPQMMMGPARGDRSPRGQFTRLFGFDPSTPPEENTGTLPQALFLMNGQQVNSLIRARGNTQLARILAHHPGDEEAIKELYLVVHSREPSVQEMRTCLDYRKEVGQRQEAFEDILWSLINSTEFQSKR